MIIIGAKGHGIEVLDVLLKNGYKKEIFFFDNVTIYPKDYLIQDKYSVIRTIQDLKNHFSIKTNHVVLGIGNPFVRRKLAELIVLNGGVLTSVISNTTIKGHFDLTLGKGLNVMHNVFLSSRIKIGMGTLLNYGCCIHHDCIIGDYVEIGPKSIITGNVTIGENSFLGAGVTVIPNIKIGANVVVGAGSVVTKNIADNTKVAGVPAKTIR